MEATPNGWWDTHDDAWRRARRLFLGAAVVVTLYLSGLAAIAVVVASAVLTGSGDALVDWLHDLGRAGIAAIVVGAFALSALAIIGAGRRGLPRRSLRYSRARPPHAHEADTVRTAVTNFALAYGMRAPTVWVIDDPAPNALACGRRTSGNVCVTTGALELPRDEIETLARFHVAALTSRAHAYAASAADLVLLGEWLTRLLWGTAGFAILTPVFGVPIAVAATYVVGIGALVLVTRPILVFADRSLVELIDDTDELVDLETVRHSNEPATLARLLLDLVEDPRRVRSRWEILHLWFERDIVDATEVRRGPGRFFSDFGPGMPAFVERCERRTVRDLLHRATVAVDLSGADEHLRRRLDRARGARTR